MQVLDLSQSVDRLNRDKVRLEQDMEMEVRPTRGRHAHPLGTASACGMV